MYKNKMISNEELEVLKTDFGFGDDYQYVKEPKGITVFNKYGKEVAFIGNGFLKKKEGKKND